MACVRVVFKDVHETLVARAINDSMQTLSQESQTPLQGIMGITIIVLDNLTLSFKHRESTSVVVASGELLFTLIKNMLNVHKLQTTILNQFKLETVNLLLSLEDTVAFSQPFAAVTDVELLLKDSVASQARVRSNPIHFPDIVIN